jgi:hypothetical protein
MAQADEVGEILSRSEHICIVGLDGCHGLREGKRVVMSAAVGEPDGCELTTG